MYNMFRHLTNLGSRKQVNAAASIIQRHVHPDANIIIGALVDERCGKQVSVTVLATGFAVRHIYLLWFRFPLLLHGCRMVVRRA